MAAGCRSSGAHSGHRDPRAGMDRAPLRWQWADCCGASCEGEESWARFELVRKSKGHGRGGQTSIGGLSVWLGAMLLALVIIMDAPHPTHNLDLQPNQRQPDSANSSDQSELKTNANAQTKFDQSTQNENKDTQNSPVQHFGSESLNGSQSSGNGSSIAQAEDGERYFIMGVMITNMIIFVIGFCGNTVVILVILKFTKIETVTDIYILNLAFADLMFITGLVFLITTMFIDHWIFGNLMCKLYMATTSLNQFASSLLLVVMSFDRFLAVCHPIYAQRFRLVKRAKIICLSIWIVCLILMTPIFAFAKINKEETCAIFWPDYKSFNCEKAFTLYSFAIGFAAPLLLIAAFYLCVIRKLRVAASGTTNLGTGRRNKSRENTNRRIEHLVIGIICTYTVCWLPYWVAQLLVSFSSGESSPMAGFYGFVLIATSLSYTNSALNPILYAFLSDNFKRRCSRIFESICSLRIFWPLGHRRAENKSTNSFAQLAECETSIARPESRQTIIMNESARLISSPTCNRDAKVSVCEQKFARNLAIEGQLDAVVCPMLAPPLPKGVGRREASEDAGNGFELDRKKRIVVFNYDSAVVIQSPKNQAKSNQNSKHFMGAQFGGALEPTQKLS